MSTPTLTPESDLPAFRAFFAAIPEEQWIKGIAPCKGLGCALQHLAYLGDPTSTNQRGIHANPLSGRFSSLMTPLGLDPDSIYGSIDLGAIPFTVNDGRDRRYRQPTPRARILAAIDDLIAGTVPSLPGLTVPAA